MQRIFLYALGAFILAWLVPFSGGSATLAAAAAVAAALLLAAVYVRALRRRDDLMEATGLELNKVRRLYHLGKNLGSDRHRQWFTELHGFVYGYLTAFDKLTFGRYQETNGHFRKLSYHLYQIPELATEKERVLYRDLLEAAGTVASARQRIQELWNGALPPRSWHGLLVLSAFAAAAVLSATGPADRLTTALLLAVIGAAIAIVRDADRFGGLAEENLSRKYVENLARLELGRKD